MSYIWCIQRHQRVKWENSKRYIYINIERVKWVNSKRYIYINSKRYIYINSKRYIYINMERNPTVLVSRSYSNGRNSFTRESRHVTGKDDVLVSFSFSSAVWPTARSPKLISAGVTVSVGRTPSPDSISFSLVVLGKLANACMYDFLASYE